MTVEQLIHKLQKVKNKEIRVNFLSIYSGEVEEIELCALSGDYLILGTNDICDEKMEFIED